LNIEAMGSMGNGMSGALLEKCKNIVEEVERQTIDILTSHKKHVEKIAASLLQNETINYAKIKSIIPRRLADSKEILL